MTITHQGCEYYVLSFRIETSQFHHDTTDLPYWFDIAGLLLHEIAPALDAPINIKKRAQQLKSYARNHQSLVLGKEINVGGDVIRDFITVDRIEKLSDKKYAVEVSVGTGPL